MQYILELALAVVAFAAAAYIRDVVLQKRYPRAAAWLKSYRAVVAIWLWFAAIAVLAGIVALVVGLVAPGKNPAGDWYKLSGACLFVGVVCVLASRFFGMRARDRGM